MKASSSRTDENVKSIESGSLCVQIIGLVDGQNDRGRVKFDLHHCLSNFDQWKLRMRKICAKAVSKNLSQNQKDIRMERYLDFFESNENYPLSPFFGAFHYRWQIFGVRVQPRNQMSRHVMGHFSLSKAQKVRMSKSEIKFILICFFDS